MPEDPLKPANPELENVAVNQSVSAPVSSKTVSSPKVPPQKIGKEVSKKKSNARFLIGCAGGLLLLFVVFVLLMVFVMSRGGGNNAVIQAFGLAPGAIRSFLLTIINGAFGFLALLFFVLMTIGIFKWTNAKKDDKEARKRGVRMTFFSLLPFIVMVLIWVMLVNFIGRIEILTERVEAVIAVTSPEDISSLQAPVEVTFSAEKVRQALSASRLGVTSATWDLDGDGVFETSVAATGKVTRLYEQRGLYTIGLQVQVTGEEIPRVYSLPLNIQEALFGAEPESGVAPLRIEFDAGQLLPQGKKLESIDWDFDGDGKYDLSGPDHVSPAYTFEKIGSYEVHLRIVDENNTVDNYYRTIEVTNSETPLLFAQIEASPGLRGAAPLAIRFDGGKSQSARGRVTGYSWDFGDGSNLQEGKSVSHAYITAGFYTITLTITEDSGQTARATATVEAGSASSGPTAAIVTTPAFTEGVLKGTLPFEVSFDASSSRDPDNDLVDFEWDFNSDGTVDETGKRLSYTFEEAGSFNVTLTIRDSDHHSAQATLSVEVEEPGVQSELQAAPLEGTVPLVVRFDGSGSSTFRGSIVSYEWDFGDGSPKTVTGAAVNHRYSTVGTYKAQLTVTTSDGETATADRQIFVREIPLTACFTSSRESGQAPLSVTFDPQCSTGGIANYSWDFGDGATSLSRKPAHTFNNPGTYNVTLEVADDKNNVNSVSHIITVLSP